MATTTSVGHHHSGGGGEAIASTKQIVSQFKQLVKEDLALIVDEGDKARTNHRRHEELSKHRARILSFIRETLSELTTLTVQSPEICEYLSQSTSIIADIKNLICTHEDEDIILELLKFLGDFLEEIDSITDKNREKGLAFVNKLIDSQMAYIFSDVLLAKYFTSNRDINIECLRILLSLAEIYPTAFPLHVVENTKLIEVLLAILTNSIADSKKRKQKLEESSVVDVEEPLQASELLSILIHATDKAKALFIVDEKRMVDLLTCLAYWKSIDPEFPEEQEWCENLHSCLRTVLLDDPDAKEKFRSLDGFELALKIAKNGGELGQTLALKLLQTATSFDLENCRKFVEAGGLKIVFPCFLHSDRKSKKTKHESNEGGEYDPLADEKSITSLGVIYNLFLSLLNEDIEYARLKAKFLEHEKLQQLVTIHQGAAATVNERVMQLEDEEDGEDDGASRDSDGEYIDLLDHGLDALQKADVILARLLSDPDLSTTTKEAIGKVSSEQVEDVRRVVADFAEKLVVLRGDATDEDATTTVRANLIKFALFQ